MMLDAEKMHDEAMLLKVQAAVVSNRMLRLDNPIMNDRLKALKRKADEAMAAALPEL